MAILVFAGVLSVPSAVFAEASWYGSLRGGVEFTSGETNFYDGASRWGIKGSAEASEGLNAVYRFEHKFSTSDAGQAGGRLAYVGLSGGLGSLTLGQVWSASYNSAGVIRDFPNWHTSPDTSARVGNALSYAVSNDVFSMQIDAIMDGKKDTGSAIDQMEFGMTISLGEIGKVAFAHTNIRDQHTTKMVDVVPSGVTGDDMYTLAIKDGKVDMSKLGVWRDKTTMSIVDYTKLTNFMHTHTSGGTETSVMPMIILNADATAPTSGVIVKDDGKYYAATGCDTRTNCTTEVLVWVSTTYPTTALEAGKDPSKVLTVVDPGSANANLSHSAMASVADSKPGHKASHVSAEFGVGAITAAIGYSQSKENGASGKSKTTFIGAKGSIGDTGMNWGAFSRVKKDAKGKETKPWTIGLSKTLGGGAWTYVEHGNDGNDGSTVVGLGINF